ncbi:probable pancreatic secretory proteinase inhibitor [Silurus meridionalis]|uniref:Kazal-like domain-containing protein n=2 Tax=Silurus TaxID=94992 RepID=A0A8T0B7Q5_SILME|nr:probable pancreatic secretory proteinase inhibitor [Silurus meridionalis]KAF7702257.1 hypothetical protein HF521_001540 [Silurus meridionalis]
MTKTVLLLVCLILIFSVGAEDKSTMYRRPMCEGMSKTEACPLNYAPVCGSDGITYVNECGLCVQSLRTRTDIMIMKDGSC